MRGETPLGNWSEGKGVVVTSRATSSRPPLAPGFRTRVREGEADRMPRPRQRTVSSQRVVERWTAHLEPREPDQWSECGEGGRSIPARWAATLSVSDGPRDSDSNEEEEGRTTTVTHAAATDSTIACHEIRPRRKEKPKGDPGKILGKCIHAEGEISRMRERVSALRHVLVHAHKSSSRSTRKQMPNASLP